MVRIAKLLKGVRSAAKQYNKRAAAADNALADLQKKVRAMIDTCKPHCLRAVEEYNRTTSLPLRIVPEKMRLYFSAKKDQVSLEVRLRYPSGREPDEEFDFDDVKRIASALRPLVNHEFSRARIPFTFGSITVPTGYYTK